MLKRCFSLLLALALLAAPVLSSAEEIEVFGEVDPEVAPATWTGSEGLAAEGEDVPWEEPLPVPEEIDPEVLAEPLPAPEEAFPEESAEAAEEAPVEEAPFEPRYGRVSEEAVGLYSDAALTLPLAQLVKDSPLLITGREENALRVAFDSRQGVVEGYVPAEGVCPMEEEALAALAAEIALYEAIACYREDGNLPLPRIEAALIGDVPAEQTEVDNNIPEETQNPTVEEQEQTEVCYVEPVIDPFAEELGEVPLEQAVAAQPAEGETPAEVAAPEEAPADPVAVPAETGPASVQLSCYSATIGMKQSLALNPVLLNADGTPFAGGSFTVKSSNKKKLKVSASGVARGLGKGTFRVTVTAANGVEAVCVVKVVNAPGKVTVSPKKPMVGIDQTLKLSVSFPKGSMASCKYSSSDASIASVDGEGNVTGHSEGTATVKVKTHNGKTAKVEVTVCRSPGYLSLNGEYQLVYDPVTGVYSTLYTATVNQGEFFQIYAENEYQTYGDIAGYESSNASVATVTPAGLVCAVGPGTSTITVRSVGGAEGKLLVTVPGTPVATLGFNAAAASVRAGGSVPAPTLKSGDIDAYSLKNAVYASSDANVFTVYWNEESAQWLLCGVNPGTANLIATAAGVSAQLPVTVTAGGPAELRFASGLIYMNVGDSYTPVVTDEYEGVVPAAIASGNVAVVTVDGGGSLVAMGEGTAVVTASYGALAANMTVIVRAGSASVALSTTSLSLAVGQRHALKATVNGDGTSSTLTYLSSNPAVATVTAGGLVVARAAGTATITASVADGVPASCAVSVAPAPTRVAIEPASVTAKLNEGGIQLRWSFGAPDQMGAVSFASNNPAVAEVNAAGYVSYKSVGTATVTIETHNGLTASIDVMVTPEKVVSDVPVYRLFAAYGYYNSNYKGYIPFTRNNAESLAKVFEQASVGGVTFSTKVMGNPSKTQLLSGISGYFANAGDNDVSVIFLCSHGHMNADYTGYRMSLPGYSENPANRNYYITTQEIMGCVSRISGNVVLIVDSCYSGAFLQDAQAQLDELGGRVAVLTAASDTKATYYNVKNTNRAVDFFSFFLLQGLGYNERSGWWSANNNGAKGSYPGYLSADIAGNGDGLVTLGEWFDFAARSLAANVPKYMKKSWYWGDKSRVQTPRMYAGRLADLVIYQPK